MEKVTRKKWTEDDKKKLIELCESKKYNKSQIADLLGRTKRSVECQIDKLGITCEVSERRGHWSEKDIERLNNLSDKHVSADVARLMKRSIDSINCKRQELNIEGRLLDRTYKWTFSQVAEALGVHKSVISKTFVKYGLKFEKQGRFYLVDEEDLLKFMKEHTNLWNATKCDYYLFYQYPWFMEKLKEDKKVPVQNRGYYWTDYQKQQFTILKHRGFTHQQIADRIGKTKKAVDNYSETHLV